MLSTILFGSSSEFRERVRQDKLVSSMSIDWEEIEDFATLYITASTQDLEALEKEIKKELKNLPVTEKDFERIQKVWIANEVRMIDNIESTVSNVYDDILKYHEVIPNKIELIKKMKYKTLKELIAKIDFQNTSIVKMMPNKE